MEILSSINSPDDIKQLDKEQLDSLCAEIREFLISNVSKTGGHLASNLGVVELTVALHRVYNTAQDRLVFDVGHQTYVHKLLTGRRDDFSTLRCFGGLSGFPKPKESVHDAAIAGHASTSVSTAIGMARARTLMGEDYNVAAVIGDGALTGGLAFEGLSNAGYSGAHSKPGEPIVIIINDNGMSIDANVGAVSDVLSALRLKPGYIRFKRRYRAIFKNIPVIYNFNHKIKEWLKRRLLPHNMFYDLGFQYLGPVDGHDIGQLVSVLEWAKELRAPVVVHVKTQKGRGYSFAESNPEAYHGVGSFDTENGVNGDGKQCFSEVFGKELTQLADIDKNIVALTASMTAGTGLNAFAERFNDRFFDVGIAEGHAVTMAAGMAKQGLTPVFAVYSTFLQRSYDMLIHDISLSNLHVVFAVDRAGIVGQDGETHQGSFDVSYLSTVPHMAVLCPSNYAELRSMLSLAIYRVKGPVALRFPRGGEGSFTQDTGTTPAVVLREGEDITLVTYGVMINAALAAAEILDTHGVSAEVVKLNMINPLDTRTVLKSLSKTKTIIVAEDACEHGSVGERLLASCAQNKIELRGSKLLNLGTGIVQQGTPEELYAEYGLDAAGIAKAAALLLSQPGGDAQ